MKLISLLDFVLDKNEFGLFVNSDEQIREYAYFLQQDLELSMFLPCDKNGNVLKEPKDYKIYKNAGSAFMNIDETLQCQMFQEAVERVLFENVTFDLVEGQKDIRFYIVGNTQVFDLSEDGEHLCWHHYTVESLLREMDRTIHFVCMF